MNNLVTKILGGFAAVAIGGASLFGGFSLISINFSSDNSVSTETSTENINLNNDNEIIEDKDGLSEEKNDNPTNVNKTNYLQVKGNSITGNLTFDNEKHEYKYTAQNSGRHRFDFDINDVNHKYKVTIYSGKNEKINYGYSSDEGLTATLEKGNTYIICVEQYNGICDYTISIGIPLSEQNVNGSFFNGSILYKDQQDIYWFNSTHFGNYRFDFDIDDTNKKYKFTIYDAKNNKITYAYSSNGGITAELKENSKYKLIIEQYTEYPNYAITVGIPNQTVYLTSNSVSDSINYVDQENCYVFVPSWSGKSVFELGINDVTNKFKLELYDSKNSKVTYGYSNNNKIYATLTAGENYKIYVKQYLGLCEYQIHIYPE